MHCGKNNSILKIKCPHCPHERVSAGLDIDAVPDVACPVCGGICDVFAMNVAEAMQWITAKYAEGGDTYAE
jgi:transcription elongation factor Elf1